MLSTLFVLSAACLFGLLFAFESAGDASQPRFRPAGLFTWLVSGNWPAKVGAGLLILGVGALLRYALLNIDVPPELKLGSGFVAAAVLGAAALALKSRPERRAIYLALGGTAFAVAYLTAYAAYDFFHYLNDVNGLALMVVVSLAAGLFAVSARAMSVAVLAMAGAYIAPKFAIHVPDPGVLYGYYLAASAVTFVMVRLRGWRPLIHLSFLFTLAGGLFFAWTHQFYQAEHYRVMQPLLLALVATAPGDADRGASRHIVTLACPFRHGLFRAFAAGRRGVDAEDRSPGFPRRRDGAGPAGTAVGHCGGGDRFSCREASRRQACLCGRAAGDCRRRLDRHRCSLADAGPGPCRHGPGPCPALGLFHARARVALRRRHAGRRAACGVFNFQSVAGQPFANEIFAQRALASALMGLGAWFAAGAGCLSAACWASWLLAWGCLAVAAELLRLQVDFLPQLVYGVLLAAALVASFPRRLLHTAPVWGALLLLAVTAGSVFGLQTMPLSMSLWCLLRARRWSSCGLPQMPHPPGQARRARKMTWPSLRRWACCRWRGPPGCLPWLRNSRRPATGWRCRCCWSAPLPWCWPPGCGARRLCLAPPDLACSLWCGQRGASFLPSCSISSAGCGPSCLRCWLWLIWQRLSACAGTRPEHEAGVVVIVAAFLVLQAMLLRAFGPDRIMSAADILQMKLPAAVSLLWAGLGAGLAWWGSHVKSRGQWSAGIALLALTALKLVFRDFGALDQLGNILALIGAGLLFLAVAWFAPIPAAGGACAAEARRETAPAAARQDTSLPPENDDYVQTQPSPLEATPAAKSPAPQAAVAAVPAAAVACRRLRRPAQNALQPSCGAPQAACTGGRF
jgi:hypothetical protein